MKSYEEIKVESENRYSTLFKECGVFWAFSNKQFEENKTPLKEGEKYVSIGAGGYMLKGNVQKLKDGQNDIYKWEKEAISQAKAKDAHIADELSNHECYYTGDITEALRVLPYPKEDVLKIYNKKRAANIRLSRS